MSGLRTLIRYRRHLLDDKRRDLAELEAHAAGFEASARAVDAAIEREAALELDDETGISIGSFVAGMIVRRRVFESQKAALDGPIAEAQEAVRAAFQDVKKYELAQAAAEERDRREAARREQAEIDEIALRRHGGG